MERLRTLRKQKGITMKQLGAVVGVSESAISLYETGNRQPDNEQLKKFADYFGVTTDYLLERTDDPQGNQFPAEEMYHIPVIATVAAGFGQSINGTTHQDYQLVPKSIVRGYNKEDLFVFVVSGDSMSPKFLPGDHVLVVRQPSVDPGDIAIVSYDDYEDGTIKKVDYEPGCDYVDLIPINPKYDPVRLQGDELDGCRICGKVIYLFRAI